jgi:hypothetical protein
MKTMLILGTLLLAGCYSGVPANRTGGPIGLLYRINWFTGSVSFCTPNECTPVPEAHPIAAP